MLLRLFFFFLLVYILYSLLKAYVIGRKARPRDRRRPSAPDGEEMVLDPQCKSYVPKGEAFLQEGRYFCSQECAKLFLNR